MMDRQRLRQVLINLFSNSIKYNRDGGTLTIRLMTTDKNRIRVEIRDTGYGIAEEKPGRLSVGKLGLLGSHPLNQ